MLSCRTVNVGKMILRGCLGVLLLLLLVVGLCDGALAETEASENKDVQTVIKEMQDTISFLQRDMKNVKTELATVKAERKKMKEKISSQSEDIRLNKQRIYKLENQGKRYADAFKRIGAAERRSINIHQEARIMLTCGANAVLDIVSAAYGMYERGCVSPHSLQMVNKACRNKNRCRLFASNRVFGDPCKGQSDKYLEVVYKCIPKPKRKDYENSMEQGNAQNVARQKEDGPGTPAQKDGIAIHAGSIRKSKKSTENKSKIAKLGRLTQAGEGKITNMKKQIVGNSGSRKVNIGESRNKDIQTVLKELSDDVHKIHGQIDTILQDENIASRERKNISSHLRSVTTELQLLYCPRDVGFCCKRDGSDQNDGSIDLPVTKTPLECLLKCASHGGATGCEVYKHENYYSCQVHTKEVAAGSGKKGWFCWAFTRCPRIGESGIR